MFDGTFSFEALQDAMPILLNEFPLAVWETVYVTILSTAFAIIIGLPLGVLLVAGDKNGVLPLPRGVMSVLGVVINLLRSVPFLILMILVFPLTRLIVGTTVGTVASIVPLVIAAFTSWRITTLPSSKSLCRKRITRITWKRFEVTDV